MVLLWDSFHSINVSKKVWLFLRKLSHFHCTVTFYCSCKCLHDDILITFHCGLKPQIWNSWSHWNSWWHETLVSCERAAIVSLGTDVRFHATVKCQCGMSSHCLSSKRRLSVSINKKDSLGMNKNIENKGYRLYNNTNILYLWIQIYKN